MVRGRPQSAPIGNRRHLRDQISLRHIQNGLWSTDFQTTYADHFQEPSAAPTSARKVNAMVRINEPGLCNKQHPVTKNVSSRSVDPPPEADTFRLEHLMKEMKATPRGERLAALGRLPENRLEELEAHVRRRSCKPPVPSGSVLAGTERVTNGLQPVPPTVPPPRARPQTAPKGRTGGPLIDPRRHLTSSTVNHGAPFFPGGLTTTHQAAFVACAPDSELRKQDIMSNCLPQQRDWHNFATKVC